MKKIFIYLIALVLIIFLQDSYALNQPESSTSNSNIIYADNEVIDQGITQRVKTAISADYKFNNAVIGVATKEGVVTLVGAITSDRLRSDLEKTVIKVSGVKRVVNRMEVKPLSNMQ